MMRALVIGSAPSVTEHLRRAWGLGMGDWTTFVINDVGVWYSCKVHHWCSIHGQYFQSKKWIAAREAAGLNMDFTVWGAFEPRSGGQNRWHPDDAGCKAKVDLREIPDEEIVSIKGSSGLVAVMLALALGAEKVAVAGVTMDDTKEVIGGDQVKTVASHRYSVYRMGWEKNLARLGRVASFGGWTRDILGREVTREWIRD